MVIWILVVPSSWLLGYWNWHDRMVLSSLPYDGIVAPSTLSKMSGQTAVQFTHILPGAFWVGVIPFQLHSEWRKKYRSAHRYTGYLFLLTSISIMVGVFLIWKRNLMYHHFFDDLPPMAQSVPLQMCLISIWFVVTAGMALQTARRRKFQEHQRWIQRHVASGMWVALQRVILMVVMSNIYPQPVSRMRQRANFGNATGIAIVVCCTLCEYCIYLQSKLEKEKQEVTSKQQ